MGRPPRGASNKATKASTFDDAVATPPSSDQPYIGIRKGKGGVEDAIFVTWDQAKKHLATNKQGDVIASNADGPNVYKAFATMPQALKYVQGEDNPEEETAETKVAASATGNAPASAPYPAGYPPNPYGYGSYPPYPPPYGYPPYPYPPYTAAAGGTGAKDKKEESVATAAAAVAAAAKNSSNKKKAATPASAATPSSKRARHGDPLADAAAAAAAAKAVTPAGTGAPAPGAVPPPPPGYLPMMQRPKHRPSLPPMVYWNNPYYKILVEYYHMVGTISILYRPTLLALCKLHSKTIEELVEWMVIQRNDYHTMSKELKDRTATFDILAKLDMDFGTSEDAIKDMKFIEDNRDSILNNILMLTKMNPSKVPRRKEPFLGILTNAPTEEELSEGVASTRQGPLWDCIYLALSDYVKIAGTMQIIDPQYMKIILCQFAKDGDVSILTMDHVMSWMATQRLSFAEITRLTNQREMTKATSKLSCLQTIGFDWDYEPRIVDGSSSVTDDDEGKKDEASDKAKKKKIEELIFDNGGEQSFLVRTDQGSYYKRMKEIPVPDALMTDGRFSRPHLPDNVEKAILRSMLPPQNQIQFSHICNLNLDLFGHPEDKRRKACTNRRKYLEKVEANNPDAFKRLLQANGLPDGDDCDVGDEVANEEMKILLKGYSARKKEPNKDIIEKAILRSMLPPQDEMSFADVATQKDKLFGPANGRIVRAAKKRRKELDTLKKDRPTEFRALLKKYSLDKITPSQNSLDYEDVDDGEGSNDKADNGGDQEGLETLFWNKPGNNILADKETQKKYRMQRNPLPLETDRLLCKHVLGGDHRFALLCNSRPSLFGLPNSRERRKIDDRRRLLREMLSRRPNQFVEVCKAHGLEKELKEEGSLKADGTLAETIAAKVKAKESSGASAAAASGSGSGDGTGGPALEDKSPTKLTAAIQLHSLRRKP